MVSPAEAAVTAAWMVAWSHPDEHTVLVAACAAPATVSSAIAATPTADMSMSRSRLISLMRTSIIEVLLSAARPPLYSQRSIGFASPPHGGVAFIEEQLLWPYPLASQAS